MKMSMASLKVLYCFAANPRKQRSGYELSAQLKLASGTLYPILARFDAEGILESRWEVVDASEAGRPRRRYYKLTPYGGAFAAERAKSLREAGLISGKTHSWSGAGDYVF